MKRRWGIVSTAVVVLSVSTATHAVSASAKLPPVRVTLHRLASSDGRYEASDRPEWVADTGDRVIAVADSDSLDVRSGTRIDMPFSSVRSASLDSAALRRGTTVPGVRAQSVRPTRRLTVVPVQWTGATWKPSDRANVDAIVAELVPWWNAMSARQETLAVKVTDTLDVSKDVAPGTCDVESMANSTRARSEERRVGKECRSRWSPYH